MENRPVAGVDPHTGSVLKPSGVESTPADVDRVVAAAEAAVPVLAGLDRPSRAALLRSLASALEQARERIIEVADAETALGEARLGGELTRTSYQLQFFAEVIEEGSYL